MRKEANYVCAFFKEFSSPIVCVCLHVCVHVCVRDTHRQYES